MPIVPVSGVTITTGEWAQNAAAMAVTAIADARSVLAYADTLPATHPGKTVRHMCCPLFMHHGYESDPGRLENVHGIQERGSHDSENIRNSMGMHRFDKRLTWRHARHILSSTRGVKIKHIRPVDLGIGPQLLIV